MPGTLSPTIKVAPAAQSPVQISYFPPPPELSDYISTCYLSRNDAINIHDVQPAAVAQLFIYLRGRGVMHFINDHHDRSTDVSVMGPCSVATPYEVDGPFHCFGAALTPVGWMALTGLSAATHGDRLYDATPFIGEEMMAACRTLRDNYRRGEATIDDMTGLLRHHLPARMKRVNPRHAALAAHTAKWLSVSLNPAVADLFEGAGYSPRQVERIVADMYGLAPKALARKYRAIRAATILNTPGISHDALAAVTHAFYDQSHMIREIRMFAGRTPTNLDDPATPTLSRILDSRNLHFGGASEFGGSAEPQS